MIHRRRIVPAMTILAVTLVSPCAPVAAQQQKERGHQDGEESPLVLVGECRLNQVEATGNEHFSLQMTLGNRSPGPIELRRAELFFASRGGFATAFDDVIASNHNFFGIGPHLDAQSQYEIGNLQYVWSMPVSQVIFAFDMADAEGSVHQSVVQFPIERSGFRAPARLPAALPGFIALQEPLELVPLSSGELWLTVIGQLVNFTGKPLTLNRWHFQVENAAGSRLADRDLLDTLEVKNDKRSLIEFMYSFKLPAGVKSGRVLIGTEATIAGRRRSGVREAPFELAKPVLVHSPVKGLWAYSNGPGELKFHIHNHHPEQRYAYDLGMRKDLGGRHSTFEGDPEKNESFFDWHQPFHAVADGTVIEVVDNVPDNFGRTENPANRTRTNSRIVVEHPGKKYSLYVHVSRGTAAVKVGAKVKAGQLLGRVGNAGQSSEPHLHFQFSELDPTGRQRALPVRFIGLKTPGGHPLSGVPKGAQEYRTE
jgi:Peptidase family M23